MGLVVWYSITVYRYKSLPHPIAYWKQIAISIGGTGETPSLIIHPPQSIPFWWGGESKVFHKSFNWHSYPSKWNLYNTNDQKPTKYCFTFSANKFFASSPSSSVRTIIISNISLMSLALSPAYWRNYQKSMPWLSLKNFSSLPVWTQYFELHRLSLA